TGQLVGETKSAEFIVPAGTKPVTSPPASWTVIWGHKGFDVKGRVFYGIKSGPPYHYKTDVAWTHFGVYS
ncbi:MAG: hypothetical protein HY929_02185, partial [Euryarchaeota archaeon]|nr:hypothetical protein [Euryarchaeota archaeon]